MSRVFKYPIEVTDKQFIERPVGWKPLAVAVQGDALCIWAEVDDAAPVGGFRVFVHGTGHTVHKDATEYIGSVQLAGGALVFHVYSEGGDEA